VTQGTAKHTLPLPPPELAEFAVEKVTDFPRCAAQGCFYIRVGVSDGLRLHALRTRLDGAEDIIIATLGGVDICQMHLDAGESVLQMAQGCNHGIFRNFGQTINTTRDNA
jgi:hypothetical protein